LSWKHNILLNIVGIVPLDSYYPGCGDFCCLSEYDVGMYFCIHIVRYVTVLLSISRSH